MGISQDTGGHGGEPPYVSADPSERELFLSQLGSFTPREREIFHKLCAQWEPAISYQRFCALSGIDDAGKSSDLNRLIEKLRLHGVALLARSLSDGRAQPGTIRLFSEREKAFYADALDDELLSVSESIVHALPTESALAGRKIQIPEAFIDDATPEALVAFMEKPTLDDVIFRVPCHNESCYVTGRSLKRLLALAIHKLRYYLQSNDLLERVAKVSETGIIVLAKKLASKDAAFWIALCDKCHEKIDAVKDPRTGTPDNEFFQAAAIVRLIVAAQNALAEKNARAETERDLDMQAIVHNAKTGLEALIDADGFATRLREFAEKHADPDVFIGEFAAKHLEQKDRHELPTIVELGRYVVHRDNIAPAFMKRFAELAEELKAEYIDEMTQRLRAMNRGTNTVFTTHRNFDADIRQRVEIADSFVDSLLKKPTMLAEAIILHGKNSKQVNSVDNLKKKLAAFFVPNTMKLKDYAEVFGLYRHELFDAAWPRLGVFLRLWIKLSGGYESLRSVYLDAPARRDTAGTVIGRAAMEESGTVHNSGAGPRRATAQRTIGKPASSRRSGSSRTSRRSDPGASKRQSPSPPRPVRAGGDATAAYSKRQRETAWEEFTKSIRHRP